MHEHPHPSQMGTSHLETRVLRVLAHIHANPGGDLSLDALSDVAAMSRFHWHRVFKAISGETCAQAVRRIRLHLAASEMIHGQDDLPDIAARHGYPSFDSFARAFAARYGMTPLAFRQRGRTILSPDPKKEPPMAYPVTLRSVDPIRLIGTPHQGAYFRISQAFSRLDAIIGARGLWPQVQHMAAIYYDSPDEMDEADLRSFAAVISDMPTPDGLECRDIPAGERAVLTFRGPYSGLPSAYDYLYGPWLAGSGRQPSDLASYEFYLNSPMHTPPEDLLTEIHLPLEAQ